MKADRYKIVKIISVAITILVAAYTLAGFLIAPWFLRPLIERQINQSLNGAVTIGGLKINPFVLSIEAQNIHLTNQHKEALLHLKSLYLNLQARSLYEGVLTFREVFLNEPQVFLGHQKNGELNFSEILKDTPSAGSKDVEATFPALILERLEVSTGTIDYFDAQLQKKFELKLTPFKAELLNVRSTGNASSSFELTANNGEHNTAYIKGTLQIAPLKITGAINLEINEPGPLIGYLVANLNLKTPQVKVSLVSDFTFDASGKDAELAFKTSVFKFSALSLKLVDDSDPLLKIESGSLDLDFSLNERLVSLRNLEAKSAYIHLTKWLDDSYNFTNILPKNASTAPSKKSAVHERDWSIQISDSRISNSTIRYSEQANPTVSLSLKDLNVGIKRLTISEGGKVDATIKAKIADKGSLESSISGSFSPLNLHSDLTLTELPLKTLYSLTASGEALAITDGTGRIAGGLRISGEQPLVISFIGDASINNLKGEDPADSSQVLAAKEIKAVGISYSNSPEELSIDQVSIDHLLFSLIFDKEGKSLFHNRAQSSAATSTVDQKKSSFTFSLNTLNLTQGIIYYRDESLPSPFRSKISEIEGTVSQISNSSKPALQVNLKARLGEQGRASYKGTFLPASSFPIQNGEFKLSDFDMLSLSPYSLQAFGRPVEGGKLHAEIMSRTEGKLIFAENNFVLDRFLLGDLQRESATTLPIRTALSILRDSQGQIKVSIPLRGDVQAPGYSYRKLLYQSAENLIVAVVASPFSLLASLYNFSSEELSHIDFQPQEYKLAESEIPKIEVIKKALTERLALRLEIRGGSSIVSDGGDPNATILDENLFELAADRASSIRDTILKESAIEPRRIYMRAPLATDIAPDGTIPSFLTLVSD